MDGLLLQAARRSQPVGDIGHTHVQSRRTVTLDKDLPRQAAVIAIRRADGHAEVCLIRKRDSDTWGIPKGLVDPGDTPEETALNEALEEAGLRGRLVGEPIGSYEYEKWHTRFTVAVFLMEVLGEEDLWEEARFRERQWTSFDEAAMLLTDHPVRPLLHRASDLLRGGAI